MPCATNENDSESPEGSTKLAIPVEVLEPRSPDPEKVAVAAPKGAIVPGPEPEKYEVV
jgi:hypothetical protein